MCDGAGQVVGTDVFGDDLTEPFVPVVTRRRSRCWDVEVAGPQDFQGWLLPSDACFDYGINVDGHEVRVAALAAIGEELVEGIGRQCLNFGFRR